MGVISFGGAGIFVFHFLFFQTAGVGLVVAQTLPPHLFLYFSSNPARPPLAVPLQPAAAPPCWGALNRGLLLRPEGSRWGLLGVGRSTTRRRSKKFRAPLGRARRAGEPLKGWWEGLDHRSKIQFLPLCGVAVLRSAKTEGAVRAQSPTGAMAQPWGKCPPPLAAKNPHS